MRLPIKRKQIAQMLSLPDFSGGLNFRDGIGEVLDNQLIDCANVWYKDGILKTRPGLLADKNRLIDIDREQEQTVEIKNFPNIEVIVDEKSYILQTAQVRYENGDNGFIKFYLIGKHLPQEGGDVSLPPQPNTVLMPTINGVKPYTTFFVCATKYNLYCFTSEKAIYKLKLNDIESDWENIADKAYVPKVLIQCNKLNTTEASKEQVLGSGVMVEGFNILSDYYQMSYNSYNPMIVTADNPEHEMRYHIVENVANQKYKGKTVTVEYNGVPHTVTLTGNATASVESTVNATDKLQMRVWRNMVTFWDAVGDSGKIVKISKGGEDDLIITAPYISNTYDKNKIFGMTQCEWYGGGNAGLKGGTRLFLCGNTSEPSLVVWSSLNNPLYFPENSYFYVGESLSPVTGFGKQSDMLVIFKSNETWCTTYQQNTNITDENLINQSVVDYSASSVYFPLVQINSNIGCAYPDSVQLCRNRLVWLGSDNKVYTLVSENAYNERSIFCVSEMVNQKIGEEVVSSVNSCDWNGYYCLCFGSEMFLMDYNCYGFTHIASYSKTEDANIKIPWFYWEFPISGKVTLVDNEMVFTYYNEGITYSQCDIVSCSLSENNVPIDLILEYSNDFENPILKENSIYSMAQTKVFDFGVPNVCKNIEQINLQLGNNKGKEIKVWLITENGEEANEIYLDGESVSNRDISFISNKAIFPCIKQVLRFGLKIETEGNLALDGAIIKFRTTGGAR